MGGPLPRGSVGLDRILASMLAWAVVLCAPAQAQGVDTLHEKPFPLVSFVHRGLGPDGAYAHPGKADFWRAKLSSDGNGVPCYRTEATCYYHVGAIAITIAGFASSYPSLDVKSFSRPDGKLTATQQASLDWLDRNVVALENGGYTWHYDFSLDYNNLVLKPGWPSAYAQAAVIHAYLIVHETTKDQRWLDKARRAALAYEVSTDKGGLASVVDGLPFFEEVPLPDGMSPHILNGHLYSAAALGLLRERLKDPRIDRLHDDGVKQAKRVAHRFDQGVWTSYDLHPRFHQVRLQLGAENGGAYTVRQIRAVAPNGQTQALDLANPRTYRANVVYGPGWRAPTADGRAVGEPGALFLLYLPMDTLPGSPGSDFHVEVTLSGAKQAPVLAAHGYRPGFREYFPLRIVQSEGDQTRLTARYQLPLHDLQWSELAGYYVEWHARAMFELHRQTRDDTLYAVSLRWTNYGEAFRHDASLLRNAAAERIETALRDGGSVEAARQAVLEPQVPPIRSRPFEAEPDAEMDAVLAQALRHRSPATLGMRSTALALIGRARDLGKQEQATSGAIGAIEGQAAVRLLHRAGIESRLQRLAVSGPGEAKVFVEARIDGRWALFDPQHAVAYTDDGGRHLSFAEVYAAGSGAALKAWTLPEFGEGPPTLAAAQPLAEYDWTLLTRGTPVDGGQLVSKDAQAIPETPFYALHEPQNAFDGDPLDDYVAARENTLPNSFRFDVRRRVRPTRLELVWNSEREYATDFTVYGVEEDGRQKAVLSVARNKPEAGNRNVFSIQGTQAFARYRFVVSGAAGQNRLLLRSVNLFGEPSAVEIAKPVP